MASRIALAITALELVGYLFLTAAATLVDPRLGLAAGGLILVIEAREAQKP